MSRIRRLSSCCGLERASRAQAQVESTERRFGWVQVASAKLRIACAAVFCAYSAIEDSRQSEMIPIEKGLPAAGQHVIVVCRRFRLLGCRDEKGVWREARRPAEELKDVIGLHELGSGE